MNYDIDWSLEENGIVFFTTESGNKYKITLNDFGVGNIIDIQLLSNDNNSDIEIFKTLNTLKYILIKKKLKRYVMIFDDKMDKNRNRKINILSRWFKDDFEIQIQKNPHIDIPEMGKFILNETHVSLIPKKVNQNNFCPGCGKENNNYKFCPNCGTNLQV